MDQTNKILKFVFKALAFGALFFLTAFPAYSQSCPGRIELNKKFLAAVSKPNEQQLPELIAIMQTCKACQYDNDSAYVKVLIQIGYLFYIKDSSKYGQSFDTAVHYCENAITVSEKYPLLKNLNILIVPHYLLGLYYNTNNDFFQSRSLFEQAVALGKKFPGNYNFYIGWSYYELSFIYYLIGDYQRALEKAVSGLEIAEKFGDVNLQSTLLLEKGRNLKEMKRLEESKIEINAAIKMISNQYGHENDLAQAYLLYAELLENMKEFKLSEQYYEKCIAIFRGSWDPHRQNDLYYAIHNLGWLYQEGFRNDKLAMKYYAMAENWIGEPASKAILVESKGSVYRHEKKFSLALSLYQSALQQLLPGFNHSDISVNPSMSLFSVSGYYEFGLSILLNKANCLLEYYELTKDKNYLKHSLAAFECADKLLDQMRWEYSNDKSKLYWRSKSIPLYEAALRCCFLLNDADRAFYFIEKSRSVLLMDKLNEFYARKNLTPGEQQKIDSLNFAIYEVRSNSEKNGKSKDLPAVMKQMDDLQDQKFNLVREIEKKDILYSKLKYDTTVISTRALKQSVLRDHQALLEIFSGDSTVYSLVITPQQLHLSQIDKPAYDSLSNSYLSYISDASLLNRDYLRYVNTSNQLYQLIFQNNPVPAGRIIISPDGRYFPFDALMTTNSTQSHNYFLNDHAISYTYSARYLASPIIANVNPSARNFMGVAPVRYPASFHLAELNGSDRSLQQIGIYFSNTDMLLSSKASKNNFLKNFSKYQIIQLYTHAADNSNNGEPVIWFADSALYLSDLISINKPVTSLIVLSACNTGTGKLYQGEGVFSFNRGFAELGIPSSITNLWMVENRATYELTELFYERLAKGKPIDIALQEAKLEFIRKSSTQKKLPYYWAAMILAGKTDAIEIKKSFSWKYLAIFSFLGVLFVWGLAGWVKNRKSLYRPKS